MNDETARPWRWSYEEATGELVIHGPPYPGKDDACDIVLVDDAYLCGDDAALIVNRVNAHDALVEALEECCDFISEEMGSINVLTPEPKARAVLEAVGSRNGEAKR